MKIGTNIKALREEHKMTQKDLAEKLFLSPQAISRYEKDEVEPNLDIIENMANIFGCSTDEIIHGKKEQKQNDENKSDTVVISVANKTNDNDVIIKCHDCGRIIKSNEAYHNAVRFKDGARINTVICDECYQKGIELDKKKDEIPHTATEKKHHVHQPWSNKKSVVVSLICGLVAFVVTLCLLLILAKKIKPGVSVGLSFLSLYLITTLLYCIFVDTVVRDMFFDISLTSFKIPVYFISADLIDNVVIAIPLKITSFILGLCATGCMICFAVIVSGIVSMFIYPFALINHSIDTSK